MTFAPSFQNSYLRGLSHSRDEDLLRIVETSTPKAARFYMALFDTNDEENLIEEDT